MSDSFMNLRCKRLSVAVVLVASACSGGGGSGSADSGATSAGGTAGPDSSSATSLAPSFDVAALTAALKGFTGGSLGDHDVVGDDLIAAMGITEALGGEADQILGLAPQGRDDALAQLTTAAPPVSGFRRRIGANDVMWSIVKNDLPVLPIPVRPGPPTKRPPTPMTRARTTPGAGAKATTTVSQSITDSVIASRVQMAIHRLRDRRRHRREGRDQHGEDRRSHRHGRDRRCARQLRGVERVDARQDHDRCDHASRRRWSGRSARVGHAKRTAPSPPLSSNCVPADGQPGVSPRRPIGNPAPPRTARSATRHPDTPSRAWPRAMDETADGEGEVECARDGAQPGCRWMGEWRTHDVLTNSIGGAALRTRCHRPHRQGSTTAAVAQRQVRGHRCSRLQGRTPIQPRRRSPGAHRERGIYR